jgi:hypothetical protein
VSNIPHRAPAHKTYYALNGRHAGARDGDVLRKTVQESHIYNSPAGIAWADSVLAQAEADGCTRMRIWRPAKAATYTCTIATFRHYAVERNHAGYGRQFVLPFRYWSVNGQPSEYERDQVQRANDNSQLQLGL